MTTFVFGVLAGVAGTIGAGWAALRRSRHPDDTNVK